jgi:anti-anti-sigma regulatory factor
MLAMWARVAGGGTIWGVGPNASIVDTPVGLRSHRFTVRGTVEIDIARELEQRLRDVVLAGKTTVIVELSDAEELSSGLIGALIRTQRSLGWRNGRLLISCESVAIRHQLADLNDIFELVETRPHRR